MNLLRDKDVQSWAKIAAIAGVLISLVVLIVKVGYFAGMMVEQHKTILEKCK